MSKHDDRDEINLGMEEVELEEESVEEEEVSGPQDGVEPEAEEDMEEEGGSPNTNPNVELTRPCTGPSKHDFSRTNEHLNILNGTVEDLNNLAASLPNIDITKGKKAADWMAAIEEGTDYLMRGNALLSTLTKELTQWKQVVETEAGDLAAGRPRLSANSGGGYLTGERALMKASALLGLGAIVQIPLWHTGIWVSIKAPQDGALLEMQQRLANEKITLGRITNGMIYSNTSVYVTSYLVNFVLQHVYDATVKDISSDHLKSIIDVRDIPTLIWGLACAVYPNGYPYARPCVSKNGECQEVVRETLALSKLSWTDNRALTNWQRKHMTKRNTKASEEDLKRYRDEHIRSGQRQVNITEELKVTLEAPTISQYEDSGFSWVDGIVRMLEDSLNVSLQGQQRDTYISDQARLTSMRQYAHWVSKIELGDEETGDDRDTIEELVGLLSSDETISDSFFTEIGKFIDDSTVSLIAIPKYTCPSCGTEQSGDDSKHPFLIPIDVARVFFTLLDQRINRGLAKSRM